MILIDRLGFELYYKNAFISFLRALWAEIFRLKVRI